jgi:hypothetical protein
VADPEQTSFTWPAVLGRLLKREDLTEAEATAAMGSVLAGEATSAQIAAFAAGLRIKGETVTEMTGLVRAMLAAATPIQLEQPLVDVVGTGGDRAGTFNVSTLPRWWWPAPASGWPSTATAPPPACAAAPTCWRRSASPSACRPRAWPPV